MIFWSSLLALLFIGFVVYINWRRASKKYEHPLVNNCLLTKYPIVFIHGRKTLFYFFRYWNLIPLYLQNHGYEVLELSLSWRNSKKRRQEVKQFIQLCEKNDLGLHFIADRSSLEELAFIEELGSEAVKSTNLVTEDSDQASYPEFRVIEVPSQNSGLSPLEKIFVHLHNLIGHNGPHFRPRAVGMTPLSTLPKVANPFLMHAISLAEFDARCSH